MSEASAADIEHRFTYHPADTIIRQAAHAGVRDACKVLAHYLDEHVPPGRPLALALTAVEEAMHWANAAIAQHVAGDDPPRRPYELPNATLSSGPPRPGQAMTVKDAQALRGGISRGRST